jgi:hypothetical protein
MKIWQARASNLTSPLLLIIVHKVRIIISHGFIASSIHICKVSHDLKRSHVSAISDCTWEISWRGAEDMLYAAELHINLVGGT